jgi:hypothetical protein
MTNRKTPKGLDISLWIAQVILSLGFTWAAYMKLLSPAGKLAAMWPWTAGNFTLVKITGIVDLLAGIGLILPWLLRIKPVFTVYAAYGTILLMIAASVFHISRGEASQIGINVFFMALAVFVAWGRRKELKS